MLFRSQQLGGLARRRRLGAVPDGLARGRLDERDVVPGPRRKVHRGQQGRLRQGRQHPALPWGLQRGPRRGPGGLPDQDDHQPARARRWRDGRGGGTSDRDAALSKSRAHPFQSIPWICTVLLEYCDPLPGCRDQFPE